VNGPGKFRTVRHWDAHKRKIFIAMPEEFRKFVLRSRLENCLCDFPMRGMAAPGLRALRCSVCSCALVQQYVIQQAHAMLVGV
jgi:hypothetical protein